MTEDEMVGWHHRLDGHEFEQAPGDSDGTGKPGVLQSMGWQRVLRVPCIAWRSNQSILKEISAEYSLEGLMLKLKLQPFGHLM